MRAGEMPASPSRVNWDQLWKERRLPLQLGTRGGRPVLWRRVSAEAGGCAGGGTPKWPRTHCFQPQNSVHGLSFFFFFFPEYLPTLLRKWQPTPVFLPGESQGRGSLVGCHLWGRTESDTTEVT